jgi:LysM repeat protein/predicted Ser/Thr protein kinase
VNDSVGHPPPDPGDPPSTAGRPDEPIRNSPAPAAELDRTIASPGGLPDIAPQLPQIEGYEVLEEIGRGSYGVVYRARQRAAGSRVVALKVLLGEAFAGAADLRRFEREVEIASDLNHPNIARIYDSGLAHGRHYFAMEYIEGQALDEFCTSRNLPLKDRLRLFTAVCEAVAFAHRRGVIHRDLKPSNIKVSNEGIPYVLDFGLAKTQSTAEDAEIRSMLTMAGMVMGTLPYMAPEQAEGRSSAIDTRTDVYALGVILYELLTGKYPYEVTGQMAEVLKRIAESEPNRPSTVNRLIGDEVETIILRALQKLPDRRYSGADDLARDVVHYLAGEPIEAKRDSGLYVLRKTMRRYRVPLAFAAIIVVLAASSAISFTLYRRAEAQRQVAETAKAEEQYQRRNAEALRQDATVNLRFTEASMAREAVLKLDRGQGVGGKLDALEGKWREAEAARQSRNWGQALSGYDAVLSQSDALKQLAAQRTTSQAAKAACESAKGKADTANAAQDAATLWQQSVASALKAESAFTKGDFDTASTAWRETEKSYLSAQTRAVAVQAYGKAKSAYETALVPNSTLLNDYGGAKWHEVQEHARIGAASSSDPIQGHEAYETALASLTGAVAEARSALLRTDTYILERGDTLSGVAARFGMSVAEIVALNNITDPNLLREGMYLTVVGTASGSPAKGVSVTTPALGSQDVPDGAVTHIVKAGDSLSSIAARYGIETTDLKRANGLTSDTFRVGWKLVIPGSTHSNLFSPTTGGQGFTVVEIRGDCQVSQDAGVGFAAAKEGGHYPLGAVVKCGRSSSADLRVTATAALTLLPSSSVSVEDGDGEVGTLVRLQVGSVQVRRTGERGGELQVVASGIVCRPRMGTFDLSLGTTSGTSALDISTVACEEGEVSLSGANFFIPRMSNRAAACVSSSRDMSFSAVTTTTGMVILHIKDNQGRPKTVTMEKGSVTKIWRRSADSGKKIIVTILICAPDRTVSEAVTYTEDT